MMDDILSQTLTDIKVELATINTKLDNYTSTMLDHESRIRKVEKLVWTLATTAMVTGGAAGTAISQFLGA